jgi:hypothetical protein
MTGTVGRSQGPEGKERFEPPAIARAWREALAVWDVSVNLSPPQPHRPGRGQSHWSGDEPLAYIDPETRQVVVNIPKLLSIGAGKSLAAVLAHEIGHHVRFPHTLGLAAELQVLERRLIPGLRQSLTNLFFDLLVNEHVGRTHAEDLCRVYRGFLREAGGETSPLFFYYLAIYEELWGKEPGNLVPAAQVAPMEKAYPGCRADARLFVQTFYSLGEVHLQFVYFCARFIRYIPDPEKLQFQIPLAHDVPLPDADDFDVSKHYKRLAERYLIEPPPVTPAAEPTIPTVPEEWEYGDNPRAIDWTATVLSHGPLAGVKPLRRDLLPDDPSPQAQEFPAVEIYLDTSGSMPDPSTALNAMTLAAQILAASTLRKKGVVRGVVYSAGKPLVSPWMYDEETARRFLLSYAGGGTQYPFDVLEKSASERRDAVRVIISDGDFLANVRQSGAMDKLKAGILGSRLLVAFLATSREHARKVLAPVLDLPGFRLVILTPKS